MNSAGSMLPGYNPHHAIKPAGSAFRPYSTYEPYSFEQKKEAVQMLQAGLPAKMVAKRVGNHCSPTTLNRWRMEQERIEEERRKEREQRHAHLEQSHPQRDIHQISQLRGNQDQASLNDWIGFAIFIFYMYVFVNLFDLFTGFPEGGYSDSFRYYSTWSWSWSWSYSY